MTSQQPLIPIEALRLLTCSQQIMAEKKPIRTCIDLRQVLRGASVVLQARWEYTTQDASGALCPGELSDWEDIPLGILQEEPADGAAADGKTAG